eukprot:COSAG05_NODE_130_length_17165_cov_154.623638_21_plen_130_part_00
MRAIVLGAEKLVANLAFVRATRQAKALSTNRSVRDRRQDSRPKSRPRAASPRTRRPGPGGGGGNRPYSARSPSRTDSIYGFSGGGNGRSTSRRSGRAKSAPRAKSADPSRPTLVRRLPLSLSTRIMGST